MISAFTECEGATPSAVCETVPLTTHCGISIRTNSAGGVDVISTIVGEADTERLFAYRSGSGNLMLLTASDEGIITALTKQRTQDLPPVGEVFVGDWDMAINSQLRASGINAYACGTTVTAVDTAAGSSTRMQKTATGADDYTDTVPPAHPHDQRWRAHTRTPWRRPSPRRARRSSQHRGRR